jgi:hypothetical protein
MADDLVTRLQNWKGENWVNEPDCAIGICKEAADRIEQLEYALRSIAEVPIGAEIPDRTTIWGLAVYMRETATDALKEGKNE